MAKKKLSVEEMTYAMLKRNYDLNSEVAESLAKHIAKNEQLVANAEDVIKTQPLIVGVQQPYMNPAIKIRKETLALNETLYKRLEDYKLNPDAGDLTV